MAQILVDSRQELISIPLPASDSSTFDKKIVDMKNQIKAKIEAYLGDIESKLDQILLIISRDTSNNNNK